MAEHKERYFGFMEYLASNGYVAVINDHRGHGESVLNPEDLGYFYDPTGVAIVEDLHQITVELKKRLEPRMPEFIFRLFLYIHRINCRKECFFSCVVLK
jgi:alpha-beta hydrolase superfamily lysophospholipase